MNYKYVTGLLRRSKVLIDCRKLYSIASFQPHRGKVVSKTFGLSQYQRTIHVSRTWFDKEDEGELENADEVDVEKLLQEEEEGDLSEQLLHKQLAQEFHLEALDTQTVFVVQPFVRIKNPEVRNDPLLMLDEAVALCDTLGWTVIDGQTIGLKSSHRNAFLGPGQIEEIGSKIGPAVTCVFFSSYRLRQKQLLVLQAAWGVPIFDRYGLILQIFNLHARTREAKLQVSLAEIPYLRFRLNGAYEIEAAMKHDPARKGEAHFEARRMMLKNRERKIRRALERIRNQREKLRQTRSGLPTVAVVGYTNCGKTSLIKALTGGSNLEPRDVLFATLDVTVHAGVLSNSLKALFLDTVGFISDIPTGLIASFSATLEDAANADLLVHVRDVSHPDVKAQDENVRQTLKSLSLPESLLQNMIVVGNKIDKIDPKSWSTIKESGSVPISCTKGYGLDFLSGLMEKRLMELTGKRMVTFRVSTGGSEYQWLLKNTNMSRVEIDEKDENYSMFSAIVSDMEISQFKRQFLRK